jgi:hypothetical protein
MNTDCELSRLRRALDSAIYSLEQIRRCAESGATSEGADWDCLLIAEVASAAIERITESCSEPTNVVRASFAQKPGLKLVSPSQG